jgi:hypothetical protein
VSRRRLLGRRRGCFRRRRLRGWGVGVNIEIMRLSPRVRTNLKLASCSKTLWRLRLSLVTSSASIRFKNLDGCSQGEVSSIWLRVSNNSLIPHQARKSRVEVESRRQSVNRVRLCDVPSVVREESMVGQGVHHRAGPADYGKLVFREPEGRISSIMITYSRVAQRASSRSSSLDRRLRLLPMWWKGW